MLAQPLRPNEPIDVLVRVGPRDNLGVQLRNVYFTFNGPESRLVLQPSRRTFPSFLFGRGRMDS
jgi:hypothetical protein